MEPKSEKSCLNLLQKKIIPSVLENLSEKNVKAMLASGSKSKPEKLVQGTIMIGQQNAGGQMPENLQAHNDIHPGFVRPPYREGYSVADYIPINQVGFDAIYKRHCATADSGYIQRKLGKFMEDLTV